MARLVGGVAVIKVGAATETEMHERRHRVEDAVQAARAARTEGIVAGGGAALIHARDAIDGRRATPDVVTGAEIVRRALEEPLRQIARNAGIEPSIAVATVALDGCSRASTPPPATTCDLFAAGVFDPVDGHALGAGQRRLDREDDPDDGMHRVGPRRALRGWGREVGIGGMRSLPHVRRHPSVRT